MSQQKQAFAGSDALYSGANIQVLLGAEFIRQRPGMYIGDTGTIGLHNLIFELIHNSINEHLEGYCNHIELRICFDGSILVADDGRGIPVDVHPTAKKSTLELVLTCAGVRPSNSGPYKNSGLNGIGARAVTALSHWAKAEIHLGGRVYVQDYSRGDAVTEVRQLGVTSRTGTKITFMPDAEIFRHTQCHYGTLAARLRSFAFLNRGLKIILSDDRTGDKETFFYQNGIAEYVAELTQSEPFEVLHSIRQIGDVQVEVGLCFTSAKFQRVCCYSNNAETEGGSHLDGFQLGLSDLFGNDIICSIGSGLTAVIQVRVPYPQYGAATRKRLCSPEAESAVRTVLRDLLMGYLARHPEVAGSIRRTTFDEPNNTKLGDDADENQDHAYAGEPVLVLPAVQHVRIRPGLYIGDLGHRGLHYLVTELMRARCDGQFAKATKKVTVTIHANGSLSIVDDGPGISVEENAGTNLTTLELIFTRAPGEIEFLACALAEEMEVEVRQNDRTYIQIYEKGGPVTHVSELGPNTNIDFGTRISFKPDKTIFQTTHFDSKFLESQVREFAFQRKHLMFQFKDEFAGVSKSFNDNDFEESCPNRRPSRGILYEVSP